MENLGIEKGKDISHLFYLNSNTLNKESNYGGITIENEKEIFLVEPLTGEKETQTELSNKEISELENKTKELEKRIQELEITNEELNKQTSQLQEKGEISNSSKSEQKSSTKKEYRGTCSKCHCREVGSYPASSMG
jgi:TolA-binding protein